MQVYEKPVPESLIAIILDNECDPQSPLEIELHCHYLRVHWEKIQDGSWNEDETIWTNGKYNILKIEVI